MLYIAYLPKSKGEDVGDRKVNNILYWYMSKTNYEYSVIAAPGYLSTTENTIDTFVKELSDILAKGSNKTKIGFLNGMNGHHTTSSGKIIIEEHYKKMSVYNFEQIILTIKKEFDHRKMLCFFKFQKGSQENITIEKLDDFLNCIYVGAILIGSSNQSKKTYFEKNASKGEADIFMFDASVDCEIKRNIEALYPNNQNPDMKENDELFRDIVIANSFYGSGHEDTQTFLKNILKDLLESGLEK